MSNLIEIIYKTKDFSVISYRKFLAFLSGLNEYSTKNLGIKLENASRYFLLFLAFVFFATLPPYLFFLLSDSNDTVIEEDYNPERIKIPSVAVNNSFLAFRVSDSSDIQPISSHDFLLFSWIKLANLPEIDERTIIFRKYNPRNINLPGYGLSLIRVKGGEIRMSLYWKDAEGNGGWFALDRFNVPPKEWFLVAFSFVEKKYAGVHIVQANDNDGVSVKRMGGIKVSSKNLPSSKGLLEFGAGGNGFFKGRIGAGGAFILKKLDKNLFEILKEQFVKPLELTKELTKAKILYWTPDGREELSPFKRNLRVTRTGQFKKRDKVEK